MLISVHSGSSSSSSSSSIDMQLLCKMGWLHVSEDAGMHLGTKFNPKVMFLANGIKWMSA